jgi:nucleotide-binding universal stress UspA family protein
MKIKKLLFVTDFEELWFDALQSLMELRKGGFEHIIFLHVIEREEVAMHRGVGYLKSEEIKLREMANVRFIDWAESLFEAGMECGAYILVGDLVPKVLSVAKEENVNLIVTGTLKKPKLAGLYVDSKTIEILRRTSIPVFVHKYIVGGRKNEKPFERPLFVTDWSSPCERALEYLISLKNVFQKLVLVHVIPEKSIKGLSRADVQKAEKDNKKRLEEVCGTIGSEGILAESHLYVGEVSEQIKRAVVEHDVSMVVAGTTGKGSWRARWLGSVSHELVEKTELPVLLVPRVS